MPKLKRVEIEDALELPTPVKQTEKEKLLELYQVLKEKNIRSIGDLENLIAKAD